MQIKDVVFLRSNPVDPDPRVEKEVNSLIKAGYNVRIIAWDRGQRYKIKKSILYLENVEVLIYRFGIPAVFGGGYKNLGAFVSFQIRLFSWLYSNRKKIQIIHACDFDTAYTAFHFAKIFKKKLVFDIFDYLFTNVSGRHSILKRYVARYEQKIINYADGVIICTEKRKYQITGTKPRRLAIIHNSPKQIEVQPIFDLNRDKVKIVYVGILQDNRFLKELAEIIKNKPNCELHIGGFGKYEYYFETLSLNSNNIFYYGKLPYIKTLELEKSCDIMTAIYDPSIDNHFYAAPNKFYEALMLGKPLIMVENTGMDDVVSENNIGKVIKYNEASLNAAIDWLVENTKSWCDMSLRMNILYRDKFSWVEMENRLLSFYAEICN